MLDLSNHALSITYLILWVAVFARQICLPVPANLFLLTAGALARGGGLNMSVVMCAGILGCLAGDLVWFEAGRHWGSQIMRILCVFSSDPHYCAQRAHKVFGRWGLRSLILAKFIPGLDGVTPPLAGIEGSERSAFLAYDSLGSFLWTALYAGLGYLFANPLTLIAASMAKFGALLAATIGIPLACYVVWRIGIMAQMLRHLRLRRITSLILNVKITAGESIAILDLVRPMRGRRLYAPVYVRQTVISWVAMGQAKKHCAEDIMNLLQQVEVDSGDRENVPQSKGDQAEEREVDAYGHWS